MHIEKNKKLILKAVEKEFLLQIYYISAIA